MEQSLPIIGLGVAFSPRLFHKNKHKQLRKLKKTKSIPYYNLPSSSDNNTSYQKFIEILWYDQNKAFIGSDKAFLQQEEFRWQNIVNKKTLNNEQYFKIRLVNNSNDKVWFDHLEISGSKKNHLNKEAQYMSASAFRTALDSSIISSPDKDTSDIKIIEDEPVATTSYYGDCSPSSGGGSFDPIESGSGTDDDPYIIKGVVITAEPIKEIHYIGNKIYHYDPIDNNDPLGDGGTYYPPGTYEDAYNNGEGQGEGDAQHTNNTDDPCVSSVIDVNELEKRFYNHGDFPEESTMHVIFYDEQLDPGISGKNVQYQKYIYPSVKSLNRVTINSELSSTSSKEYIAMTVAHEYIHAYLNTILTYGEAMDIRDVSSYTGQYLGDLQNYKESYIGSGMTEAEAISAAQHEVMAQHFIDDIAGYINSLFPDFSSERATELAWNGLKDTQAWNRKNAEDQNDIIDTIIEERSGSPNSQGTNCN